MFQTINPPGSVSATSLYCSHKVVFIGREQYIFTKWLPSWGWPIITHPLMKTSWRGSSLPLLLPQVTCDIFLGIWTYFEWSIELSFLFLKECYRAYAELQSILVMQDCFAFQHDSFRFIFFFQNWKSQKKLQSGGPGSSPGCCGFFLLKIDNYIQDLREPKT